MPLNTPFDLQDLDDTLTLGDIKGIADAISNGDSISTQNGITASTTQTQAGGTRIFLAVSRATSAAASDAVTLGFRAQAGMAFTFLNDSGNVITMFPAVGDKINDALTNAGVTIANNTMSEYFCPLDGLWFGGAVAFEA